MEFLFQTSAVSNFANLVPNLAGLVNLASHLQQPIARIHAPDSCRSQGSHWINEKGGDRG